jgi:hypothetical protein
VLLDAARRIAHGQCSFLLKSEGSSSDIAQARDAARVSPRARAKPSNERSLSISVNPAEPW